MSRPFWIFLLLVLVAAPALRAEPDVPDDALFLQETRREVRRALKRRDGLVLWIDRESGETETFGNPDLLQQPFLPGSVLKLLTAELALRSGREWQYRCTGRDRLGGRRRYCWTRKGHGEMNLAKALGQSCNLYFSWLGTQLGYPALRQALAAEGFSGAARLPEAPEQARDAADLAIGDLPAFAATPEEVKAFWLRYLDKLGRPDFAPIRQGLRRAVREGTAKRVGVLDLEILGKTGTGDALRTAYKTNGWFLGAYPPARPRWALLVFLTEAHGFDEAAELAEAIFRAAKEFGVLP